LFHNFEGIYGITPTHGFKIENKAQWPEWYKEYVKQNGRPCEIEYYHYCFLNVIDPKGFEDIKYRLHYKTHLSQKEIDTYRQFVEKYTPEKLKLAEDYYNRGKEFKNNKNIEKATECFKKSVEVFPPFFKSYYMLGGIYLKEMGDKKTALEYYEKSLSIYPYDRDVLVMAGFCCRVLKKHKQAVEIYRKIIEIFGENAWMDFYYGVSLGEAGHKQEALLWLQKALESGYEKPGDIEFYIKKFTY
jgi:tetratricopeptide (TPR) repeat protein